MVDSFSIQEKYFFFFTQEIGSVVGDPASEMLNPERPAIDGPRLEQSRILLVLNLHFRHVALSRASYRAFHVQHAQQSGPLRNRSRYSKSFGLESKF